MKSRCIPARFCVPGFRLTRSVCGKVGRARGGAEATALAKDLGSALTAFPFIDPAALLHSLPPLPSLAAATTKQNMRAFRAQAQVTAASWTDHLGNSSPLRSFVDVVSRISTPSDTEPPRKRQRRDNDGLFTLGADGQISFPSEVVLSHAEMHFVSATDQIALSVLTNSRISIADLIRWEALSRTPTPGSTLKYSQRSRPELRGTNSASFCRMPPTEATTSRSKRDPTKRKILPIYLSK